MGNQDEKVNKVKSALQGFQASKTREEEKEGRKERERELFDFENHFRI